MLRKLIALVAAAALLAPGLAHSAETEVNACFGPTLDMPYGKAHVYWANLVEKESGGKLRMNVFPSDQLGSGKDCIDQAWMGDPIIYSTDASFFADLGVPDNGQHYADCWSGVGVRMGADAGAGSAEIDGLDRRNSFQQVSFPHSG